jgi:hypothetical protein
LTVFAYRERRVPRGVAMVEYFLKTQPEDVDEGSGVEISK